jgi:ComF family protein
MVAEHFCSACGTPFLNASPLNAAGLCGLCRTGLTRFDAAFAFGEYDSGLRKLIHLFKYGKVKALAKPLAGLLVRALPLHARFDLIVPMPMHWLRRMGRGFNQSELLARHVAARTSAPVAGVLRRTRRTPPQAGLTRAQRRDNVAGAFAVTEPARVGGRHILLVDDVLTTGATANACAAVLKRAGAARVTIATVARADRRKFVLAGYTASLFDSASGANE